jgi:DNA-binding NarL/FixJ family response regulator
MYDVKTTKCQILLIMPPDEESAPVLREMLINRGFGVIHATHAGYGIQKATECVFDLIICQHEMDGQNGFKVFNMLQPTFSKREIPFLLFLNEFRKEDILIGLEMGIDNFIIYPFDESVLLNKIEKQLLKSRKSKIFDPEQFNQIFETSPVPRFISENDRITMINEAFSRLTGVRRELTSFPKINEVFDFSGNEINELNFRKCVNGLKEYCLFKSVPLHNNVTIRFDIQMVYNGYFGKNVFTSEAMPAQSVNINGCQASSNGSKNKVPGIVGINGQSNVMLTLREKEVLKLSTKGLAIKQIADRLAISSRTVEKHRSNIMEKTKTSNIIEAMFYFQGRENSSQNEKTQRTLSPTS